MKRYAMVALLVAVLGCGDEANFDGGSTSTSNGSGGAAATSVASTAASGGAASSVSSSSTSSSTGGGGVGGAADPAMPGPFDVAELDDSTTVQSTGNNVAIHAAYPSSGTGPFPVVIFGHGFQLPPSQYYDYLRHLASFGYVALTVDFPTSFLSPSHVDNADELAAGIDWALGHSTVGSLSDSAKVGASGHSLGGKLALLAATQDPRIKAVFTLDPVDGATGCNPTDCPDVSALMPIPIPTGFVGETTDASGGFQPCAPAADNFETFYAGTSAPSVSVNVLGANHMSFLDDVASCGITCSFCNQASVDSAVVGGLSQALMVAFYERHLRGDTAYDTYLTGALANERYVATGLATITSK